jgi:hypothetical protein
MSSAAVAEMMTSYPPPTLVHALEADSILRQTLESVALDTVPSKTVVLVVRGGLALSPYHRLGYDNQHHLALPCRMVERHY